MHGGGIAALKRLAAADLLSIVEGLLVDRLH